MRVCARVESADQALRDARAAQAVALASLRAATNEAGICNSEATAAEAAQDAAAVLTATADGELAARVSELARAREEKQQRQQDAEKWVATTDDAKAVANSVGGLGRAIAGATGQAILDLVLGERPPQPERGSSLATDQLHATPMERSEEP